MTNQQVGLHIRLTGSLRDLVDKALRLELPFFQCFFLVQGINTLLRPTQQEIFDFVQARRQHFKQLYAHGSYWINLAGIDHVGHYALDRELHVARLLEFTHLIVHPGSAKGAEKKEQGIDAAVRAINKVMRKQSDITLVLENTAHGNMTVGGDLHDLAQIYAKLDHPDRVAICLDTAHAHVYGYDIITPQGRDQFIRLVDELIGISRVALVHVNDTYEQAGSKLDRHQVLGKGTIGLAALQAFATDPRLVHIPILTEPPVMSEEQEHEQLMIMRSWYENF